jgi:hypothetical protein
MKQSKAVPRLSPYLLFALMFLAAGPARAACSNPTGAEKDMNYNLDYHTYQFCNGTNWMSMAGGGGGSGPMSLISTQTASASASLQFTNLPTSYNTLFLNCAGLIESSTGTFLLQVGEGATPTWQTGAHYSVNNIWTGTGNASVKQTVTTTATDLSQLGGPWSTTKPLSLKMYIDNVGSSTLYKNAIIQETSYVDTSGYFTNWVGSYWNNDTNPITGLQVTVSTGNLTSGTCSLYGMN